MLYIDGMDLTNVVSFKEASVDFKEALTYVRGINLDSDLANPTGNGTGKSLFFSSIPNVWYSATPLALRKKSRKDILARKGSSIGLLYRPSADGPEYEIIQKGNGYHIYENGKDLEIPTIPKAEAFIKKMFPITEIDYYSRCYVSTQRPYALLRDSDSDRLQHIIDIARLDQYSALHKHFSVQASSIKDNEIRLSVLEQQLASLDKKLKATSAAISKKEYLAFQSRYAELDTLLNKNQTANFDLLNKKRALSKLVEVERELDELRAKYKFKETPTKQLKKLRSLKKAAQEWQAYEDGSAHIEKSRVKLESKIAELKKSLPKSSFKEVKAAVTKLKAKIEGLEESIEEATKKQRKVVELKSDVRALNEAFSELGVSEDQVDMKADYDATLAEIRLRLKLQSLLDHADAGHDKGSCPTCQSDIDFDSIRKMLKNERKNLDRYTGLREAKNILTSLKPAKAALRKALVDFNETEFEEMKSALAAAEKAQEKAEESLDVWRKVNSYTEQLEALDLPEQPESEKPSMSLEAIEEGIDLCHEIEKHLNVKASIIEQHQEFSTFRSVAAVDEEYKSTEEAISLLSKKIRKLETEQAEVSKSMTAYEQYVNTVNVYLEEKKSTEAEIEKLKPLVADKKLVTILTKAYGTKGLRAYAANTFCSLLQTNLNHYRELIFTEPFEFLVEASDTGVSIQVDRNNGKTDAVSDVRHLSGAESECFALLCAASLITLTPEHRQLNLMVLDEPTSHMHPVTKDLFTTKFLPFLRELVPTVFVIDNTNDPMLENSQQWTVVKKKGVSKLQFM